MYEFESRVRYSETDAKGRLTWLALMDYFQDCSVFHSNEAGLDIARLNEHHWAWVLSSWQIDGLRLPMLGEHITTQTWAYEMNGFYGYRNFSMNGAKGERLAYANSVWVFMDTESGRPLRIPQEVMEAYGCDPQLPMECSGRKIALPPELEEQEAFVVPPYFIDTNHHMNNSRYVQVAYAYVPEDFAVTRLRVEYKKAALCGDRLVPRVSRTRERVLVALCAPDQRPYAVVEFWQER